MINPDGHTTLEYTVYGADLRELIGKAKKFPEALYGSNPSNDVRVVTWAMPCQAQAKL
jgi:hypothetical protein